MRDLIINGNIAARIDSQNSALLSTRENQRSDCYRNVSWRCQILLYNNCCQWVFFFFNLTNF